MTRVSDCNSRYTKWLPKKPVPPVINRVRSDAIRIPGQENAETRPPNGRRLVRGRDFSLPSTRTPTAGRKGTKGPSPRPRNDRSLLVDARGSAREQNMEPRMQCEDAPEGGATVLKS